MKRSAVLVILAAASSAVAQTIPAFPGADGAAANITGGRGEALVGRADEALAPAFADHAQPVAEDLLGVGKHGGRFVGARSVDDDDLITAGGNRCLDGAQATVREGDIRGRAMGGSRLVVPAARAR